SLTVRLLKKRTLFSVLFSDLFVVLFVSVRSHFTPGQAEKQEVFSGTRKMGLLFYFGQGTISTETEGRI
ncbi:MAG: hypothetical protein IJJ85_09700, partial [Clostridia bacterium]|nr:hypothetical protein [Clostridia bacterium]